MNANFTRNSGTSINLPRPGHTPVVGVPIGGKSASPIERRSTPRSPGETLEPKWISAIDRATD